MLTTDLDIGAARLSHRIPRVLQRSEHRVLLASGDLLATSAAVAISIWIWSITAGFSFGLQFLHDHSVWFAAAPAWLAAFLPAQRMHVALSVRSTAQAIGRAVVCLLIVYLALYFYLPPRALPRLVALYILWEGALLLFAWRLSYIWFFSRSQFLPRVMVVGEAERGAIALSLITDSAPAAGIPLGVFEVSADTGRSGLELLDAIARSRPAEVVVATRTAPDTGFLDALLQCMQRGIGVVTLPQLYEQLLRRIPVQHVDREWLLGSFSEAIRLRDASEIAKRCCDIAGAAVGLGVLALIAPFVVVAIWFEDGRPFLFRQTRVGRAGAVFHIVKFRTMVRDAEQGDGPRWASRDDPRVTRVGRLLRRTRLDELPNLLNVIRGEMSLVGPRPERPELVETLERSVPFYRMRLIAKPGLTGWAQVNRPYDDTIADASEKLEYDLYYLKYRSISFDAWILLKTVGTVLRLKGR